MASVSTSIDIGSPPDRIWDLVTGLDRLGDGVTVHRERGDAAVGAESSLRRLEQRAEG
jgi:hypothetical protein